MKYLVCIHNPNSGSAKSRSDIERSFKDEGYIIDFLDISAGYKVLEQQLKKGKYTAVVAAGGDGTVRLCAQLAIYARLPLGILPVGTLNHFAKDLGLPLDIEEAVKVVAGGVYAKVDYCTVNDEVFVNNASIGIYPATVLGRGTMQNRAMKLLGTMTAFAAALFNNHTLRCSIAMPEGTLTQRSPLIFMGNNKYHVEKPGFTSREKIDEGRIFFYMVRATRRRALVLLAFLSIFGMRARSADFIKLTNGPLVIDSPSATTHISLDGEIFKIGFPLHVRMHPKKLPVFHSKTGSKKNP